MVKKITDQTGSAPNFFQERMSAQQGRKNPTIMTGLGLDSFLPVLRVPTFLAASAPMPLSASLLLGSLPEFGKTDPFSDESETSEEFFSREQNGLKKLESALIENWPDSAAEQLQRLALVEQLAQKYLQRAGEEGDEDDGIHLAELSYELLGRLSFFSSHEEVQRRAAYYDGLRFLVGSDVEDARSVFAEQVDDLPEAKAILETMQAVDSTEHDRQTRDHHRMLALSVLDIWSGYADEGQAHESDQANGVLGVTVGTIRYYTESGKKTMLDHVAEKWNLDRELIRAIKEKIKTDEAETVHEALSQIAGSADPFALRAKQLLEEETKKDNCGSYLLAHLIGYVSEDQMNPEKLQRLMKDADESSARLNAASTPYAIYSFLKATEDDAAVKAECERQLTALQKGKKLPSIVWDMIRTTGTDDLAQLAIMAGASKAGSIARLAALGRLEKAGVTGYKALALAYGAEIAVEGTAMWAMNTVYESMLHDTEKVFEGRKLLKSWGANLIMITGLKFTGGLASKYSPDLAKFAGFVEENRLSRAGLATLWGVNHFAGLSGMVGTTQLNQALGLSETPKGGFKESLAHDLFSYVKYGAAQKGVDHVLGADFVQARDTRHRKIKEAEGTILTSMKGEPPVAGKTLSLIEARGKLKRLGNPLLAPMWSVLGTGLGGGSAGAISRRSLPQSLILDSHLLTSPRWRPLLAKIQTVQGLINDLPKGSHGSPKVLASQKMASLMKEITERRNAMRVKDLNQYEALLCAFEDILKSGEPLSAKNIQTYRARSIINDVDVHLGELDQSLFILQGRDPKDSKVQEEWTVIADYLQQNGDPRGVWIALALERQRLSIEGDPKNQLSHIINQIGQVRRDVMDDMRSRFDAEVGVSFSLQEGFKITLDRSEFQNVYRSSFITDLLASRYSFLMRGLRIDDPAFDLSDFKTLIKSQKLRFLTSLNISGDAFSEIKLQRIVKESKLANLTEFNGVELKRPSPKAKDQVPFELDGNGKPPSGSNMAADKGRQGKDVNASLPPPSQGSDEPIQSVKVQPATLEDVNLQKLNDAFLAFDLNNPGSAEIKEHWAVIGDRLSELGDSRGEWIALELKRQELLTHPDNAKALEAIDGEISRAKAEIEADIKSRFALEVQYRFDPIKGFELRLDGRDNSTATRESFGRFLQSGYASLLSKLKIEYFKANQEWLLSEANLTQLTSLRELSIVDCHVEKNLPALLQSPILSNLQTLDLSINSLNAEGAHYLANSENLIKLQTLNLRQNNLGASGARFLANSKTLINLQTLDVGVNDLGDKGARFLADSKNLINLQTLNLDNNYLYAEDARNFADSKNLINLQTLSLRDNYLGAEGVRYLANSENLINLRTLDLGYNRLGAEGVRYLANSKNLINLRTLDLDHNQLGAEGVRYLANSENLINLQTLHLRQNNLGAEGVRYFANSENLINLRTLYLEQNGIGAEGAHYLADSKNLINLQTLHLWDNYLDAESERAITDSSNLPNLVEFNGEEVKR